MRLARPPGNALALLLTLPLVLMAPLAHSEPPADGFYRTGSDQAWPLRVDQALLVAQDNQNEVFSLQLRVPYDEALSTLGSLCLVVAGQVHVSDGAGSSGTMWSHPTFALDGRETADAVATFLGITPRLRRHPGHRLDVAFVPPDDPIPMGPAPEVTFRMKNVGDLPVAFVQGGRNRASRDNQYDFLARRSGRLVPDVGTNLHWGGISVRRVLQPGETFEERVDLAKWFRFDEPGPYEILGTYALTLLDLATDDQVALWEDYATASFLVDVAPIQLDPDGAIVGAWSEPARGIRGRLVTSLDDLDRGGSFVSVYLELEHVGEAPSEIEIGADRQVDVELLDEAMQPIPSQGFPYDGPVSSPTAIVLTGHGRVRTKVSSGGCGVPPAGVMICFLNAAWFIPETDMRTFYLRGTLRREGKDEGRGRWIGRLDLPPTPVDRRPD